MESPFVPPYSLCTSASEILVQRADSALRIDRNSFDISTVFSESALRGEEKCWGILGIVESGSARTVITISDVAFAGSLNNACVYSIKEVGFIEMPPESEGSSSVRQMITDLNRYYRLHTSGSRSPTMGSPSFIP